MPRFVHSPGKRGASATNSSPLRISAPGYTSSKGNALLAIKSLVRWGCGALMGRLHGTCVVCVQ